MIGFYVLGAIALLILGGNWLFDLGWKRGYQKALDEAKDRAEKSFKEGKLDEANWWIAADDGIETERKKIWGEEIGA